MIPMRHSTIFRSRWMALLWAAGIIWFALQVAVPDSSANDAGGNDIASSDGGGSSITNEDIAALDAFVNGN
jgi:hypothetical protein